MRGFFIRTYISLALFLFVFSAVAIVFDPDAWNAVLGIGVVVLAMVGADTYTMLRNRWGKNRL